MSLAKVRAALESRLNGMSSVLPTAWENVPFSPTEGVAWQKANLLMNDPVDYAVNLDVTEQRGLFQVTTYFPEGNGTATASAYAKSVADRFAPDQTLTSGGVDVEILSTARIATSRQIDGWWVTPITIPWRSFNA